MTNANTTVPKYCNARSCISLAAHGFIAAKDGEEYRFYGCKEHFLELISVKVNDEHFEYKNTFAVEMPQVPQTPAAEPFDAKVLWPPPVTAPAPVQKPSPIVASSVQTVSIDTDPVDDDEDDDVVGIDSGSGRQISGKGKLRAMIDEAEAKVAGFTLAQPLYSVGTKVVDVGVQNFRRSRQEFEAKPKVQEACDEFINRIAAEDRRDAVVNVNEVCMLPDGHIGRLREGELSKSSIVLASPKTLGQLMVRSALENTGTGYLEACPPILRAHNVNHWLSNTDAGKEVKFRMRKVLEKKDPAQKSDHEIYAVVGPNYATFDADKIANIVKDICPPDGRAEVVYDGFRTRISVTFHSDIKPEDCVTGELFKAGIIIKTSDAGDGAIQVSSFVERNLCLNLIIIDKAVQKVVRRRHTGDQDVIAEIIQAGIQAANEKVAGFASKWGFANKDELLKNTIDLEHKNDSLSPRFSLSHELFMAGLFNGMIERQLVTVRGKRTDAIDNLVSAWNKEPAMTRAGVVNAVTRYAHESEQNSPWDEDSLQEDAGSILFSNRPLPWMKVVQD